MLQLIEFFKKQNWQVFFGTVAQKNNNSIDLTEFGVEEFSIELNSSSFDDLLKKIDPTLVVFDRFMTEEQFGWRVSEHCPNALRILDTEDLHCLRKTRQEVLKKGVEFSDDLLLNSTIAKREIASIYRCDLSLIISTFEMNLLKNVFNVDETLIFHVPFLLDRITEEVENGWKPFEERQHFVSVGNFLHAPNVDSVIRLKKYIWPKIRKRLPEAKLHIYGAYPTQQVLEMNNPNEGFFVHGFVEDKNEVFQNARVLLAPLQFGAGIKGKLTDAMLHGTPSVTTSIGAEGMHGDLPWNGFVEDDFEHFALKAVDLYTDESSWQDSQKNGIRIVNEHYNKEALEKDFLIRLDQKYQNLHQDRIQNFTGQMLEHHTMRSTKYLSKWIEAKNK